MAEFIGFFLSLLDILQVNGEKNYFSVWPTAATPAVAHLVANAGR